MAGFSKGRPPELLSSAKAAAVGGVSGGTSGGVSGGGAFVGTVGQPSSGPSGPPTLAPTSAPKIQSPTGGAPKTIGKTTAVDLGAISFGGPPKLEEPRPSGPVKQAPPKLPAKPLLREDPWGAASGGGQGMGTGSGQGATSSDPRRPKPARSSREPTPTPSKEGATKDVRGTWSPRGGADLPRRFDARPEMAWSPPVAPEPASPAAPAWSLGGDAPTPRRARPSTAGAAPSAAAPWSLGLLAPNPEAPGPSRSAWGAVAAWSPGGADSGYATKKNAATSCGCSPSTGKVGALLGAGCGCAPNQKASPVNPMWVPWQASAPVPPGAWTPWGASAMREERAPSNETPRVGLTVFRDPLAEERAKLLASGAFGRRSGEELFYSHLFPMHDLCSAEHPGPNAIAALDQNDPAYVESAFSTVGFPHEDVEVRPFDEQHASKVNYTEFYTKKGNDQYGPNHVFRRPRVAYIDIADVETRLAVTEGWPLDPADPDHTPVFRKIRNYLNEALGDGAQYGGFDGAIVEIPWRPGPYKVSGSPSTYFVNHAAEPPSADYPKDPPAVLLISGRSHFIIRGVDREGGTRRPVIQMKGMPHTSATGGMLLVIMECSHFLVEDIIFDGNRAGRGPVAEGDAPWELNDENPDQLHWGGGVNVAVRGSHHVHFRRVSSNNAPDTGFSLRMERHHPDLLTNPLLPRVWPYRPRDVIFEDCEAVCSGNLGLTVETCHRLRVLRGQYSFSHGFWTQGGIDLEGPTEDPAREAEMVAKGMWPAVGICDVLIEDVRFVGDWKGVQINRRFGTRGITIRGCTFVGTPRITDFLASSPLCLPTACDPADRTCGISAGHDWSHRSRAIASQGAWVAIVDNKFERYTTLNRAMDGIVEIANESLGRVFVCNNRFRETNNVVTWVAPTAGETVKMYPIFIQPRTGGIVVTEHDLHVLVADNVLDTSKSVVFPCFIYVPEYMAPRVEVKDNTITGPLSPFVSDTCEE